MLILLFSSLLSSSCTHTLNSQWQQLLVHQIRLMRIPFPLQHGLELCYLPTMLTATCISRQKINPKIPRMQTPIESLVAEALCTPLSFRHIITLS
ncbi:hypothetical protein EDC01DRAFT_379559 [Geopyxis carbonaria]|nr:hypothetical protein EDC01DRAFT_379559 [Geopyxis carbonaria]